MNYIRLWCLCIFIGTAAFNINMLSAQGWGSLERPIHLQRGFYYMLDYPVNIRSQPNLQSTVIGRLALHDRIEILENTDISQRINGMWAYWYRIRHNNQEGYIWGGFIAMETFIFDIDGNGQDDFFQVRITQLGNTIHLLHPPTDIFIYINGRRVSTENVGGNDLLGFVIFEPVNNNVRMTLRWTNLERIYEIDATGTIRFIERNTWQSEI